MPKQSIVALIRRELDRRKMSNFALSKLSGVSQSTLGQAFVRGSMTTRQAEKCLHALGFIITRKG